MDNALDSRRSNRLCTMLYILGDLLDYGQCFRFKEIYSNMDNVLDERRSPYITPENAFDLW